jgi:Flp pilus assembly protein TadG
VELAILLPVIVLVLAMLVIGGRIALAGQRIDGVADAAARDASIAPTPAAAQQAAVSSAQTALAAADLHCVDVKVTVDVAGFAATPGTPAAVTVNVWCTVDLSDIGAPGLPGSRTLHDQAASPLELARG